MAITDTLPNFPAKNQRTEGTSDGMPPENGNNDCVPTAIAAALEYLTGRPYNGDAVKDAVYGQGYVGVMAAAHFVAYCQAQGVTLSALSASSGAALVAITHTALSHGEPVLLTIPSQWGAPLVPGASTHVVVACGYGDGELRCMNPWIAPTWHDGPDSYWAAEVCYGEVWVLAKEANTMAGIPTGWHDDGKVLTGPHGEGPVRLGFRDYILAHPWFAGDVALGAEAGTGNGTTQQQFRYTTLTWTSATGVVEHDRLEMVEQESQRTQAQNQQLTAQVAALQNDVNTLEGSNGALAKQVNGLQVQLAQAQQQQQSAGPQTVAEAMGVLVELIARDLGIQPAA